LSSVAAIVSVCVSLGAGAGLAYVFFRWQERRRAQQLNEEQANVLQRAGREAESLLREARLVANEEVIKLREQTEQGFAKRRQEVEEAERRLADRECLINQQLEGLVHEDRDLRARREQLQQQKTELESQHAELARLLEARKEELARISSLTEGEARQLYLNTIEKESLSDAAKISRGILDNARRHAEEQAKRVLSIAIQRYSGEYTFENTTATINLPNEEIKGRIIGREGRNIRAFEALTGITVLIDDTPNAVVLSGFDPVRREVAREAMHRLICDGRIHPTRIEEVVLKVREEIDETILQAGEEAVIKLGLPPLHLEITKLLGRLKFRRSFSQNILDHSIEVANLMGLLAAEMNLDTTIAKKVGLLHDIGKAVNHEVEGAHAIVGSEILKRYGEIEEVINGVASHHDEVPAIGPWGILAGAADAISASRPGARSETMTTYIKRLENLERIGCSFPGVDRCYAVQAGRELRVMVQPEKLSDEESFALARDIVRRIEEELQYPGQIRVTVIRESRCVEYAK
jgi:ribonuclease Y